MEQEIYFSVERVSIFSPVSEISRQNYSRPGSFKRVTMIWFEKNVFVLNVIGIKTIVSEILVVLNLVTKIVERNF